MTRFDMTWRADQTQSRPEDEDEDNHSDDHENNVSFPLESIQDRIFYQIWDFSSSQDLLFGMGNTSSIDLHTLHPNQVQIFQLWQLYLDNVNPLLRLTHAPSFQARIVQAVSNLDATEPEFEAFLFSIYCIALTTIDDAEAQTTFGQLRDDMLRTYRFACQQALFKCNFMRTKSVDCLTALFLYIVRPPPTPQHQIFPTNSAADVYSRIRRPARHVVPPRCRHPHRPAHEDRVRDGSRQDDAL